MKTYSLTKFQVGDIITHSNTSYTIAKISTYAKEYNDKAYMFCSDELIYLYENGEYDWVSIIDNMMAAE